MDELLRSILNAAGVSGSEKEISAIMKAELDKSCEEVYVDNIGNVIARKGHGKKKIMLAAHMDEVGLLVKHISKEGYISFVKIGGIDDRVLPAQRVIIKAKNGDVLGIIGTKPPHLLKDEEKKQRLKYENMFIDIGCQSKEEVLKKVSLGDSIIFEPNAGKFGIGMVYAKAVDNRVGCYALLKIMERINVDAQVFAVATVQEEVGLKGARTASFKIAPDFALVLDTTVAGDTPHISEQESPLKLGEGVAITVLEASGRGIMVNEKTRDLMISAAARNKIKFQIAIIEGGMTDGAMIYMNREGIPTGVLSIPTRYLHSASSVFSLSDVESAVDLALKVIPEI
jgi:tetrahedral aminopeptidase